MPYLVLFKCFFQTIKLSAEVNIRQIKSFEAKVRQAIVIAIGNIVFNFHQRPFYLSTAGAKFVQYAIVLFKLK